MKKTNRIVELEFGRAVMSGRKIRFAQYDKKIMNKHAFVDALDGTPLTRLGDTMTSKIQECTILSHGAGEFSARWGNAEIFWRE